MVREINKTKDELKSAEAKEIRCLKLITWKMLRSIEKAADLYNSATPTKLTEIELPHHLLSKGKVSLVGELVILTDLMLRLNQNLRETETRLAEEDEHDDRLSDADIYLVQNFVARKKTRRTLRTTLTILTQHFEIFLTIPSKKYEINENVI